MALMGKKGMFYTLIAISLMTLVIYSFSLSFSTEMQERAQISETIVRAMDYFFDDMSRDMERAAYISGFRAIVTMQEYIFENGKFIGDGTPSLQEAFEELVINGTMGGTPYILMENNTFRNWTDRMMSRANDIYIVMNYSVNGIRLYQTDPWSVLIDINMTVDLRDQTEVARFNRQLFGTAEISIEYFNDPFYTVKTNQEIQVQFQRSPYEGQFVVNLTDTTYFGLHVNGSYYSESPAAPSFLMRFEDDLSASDEGIESFINLETQDLFHAGRCDNEYPRTNRNNRSMVDYIYCSSADPSHKNYTVAGMPGWFIIDNLTIVYNESYSITRQEKYFVDNLTTET